METLVRKRKAGQWDVLRAEIALRAARGESRVRQWIHSPDPQFREKTNEICELYRKPLPGSVVLSIDEKTGIQAIERIGPGRPPALGRVRREEFEYVRHATQTLIAALDVPSGTTLCSCGARRTQKDLDAFMRQVARAFPWRIVHIIWDNLNTHQAQRWAAFNGATRDASGSSSPPCTPPG